jgi:hypothetical protein
MRKPYLSMFMPLGIAALFSSNASAQGGCITRHVEPYRIQNNTKTQPLAANVNRTSPKPSAQLSTPPSSPGHGAPR